MAGLDERLIRVSIDIGGRIQSYDNLAITASGVKYSNPNLGECNVTIANLEKSVSDYILTETSPFNRNRTSKRIIVEAGRRSTGLSLLYSGNIFRSSISQPPDAVLSIRALSGFFAKGTIVSNTAAPTTTLSQIAQQIANDLGFPLVFEADDKSISNYNFTGAVGNQLDKFNELADINVFIDNDQLIVKNVDAPLRGKLRRLDAETGMVGVPTFTEQGAKITFFYDTQTVLGGQLAVTSRQYPALTGNYIIYKLNYNIANRDVPFYYTAECRRLQARL